jgi:hypothetical protein
MGVDGHITSRASKILVLPVGNMEMSLWVAELLGETKIDNIELIASFTDAHEGVVRLDVAMNEILRMYVFDSRYLRNDGRRKETPKTDWTHQLICKEQDGLETELPVAEVEEVLEWWAKEIENHGVVIALSAKSSDERDADITGKGYLGLIFELGMLGLHGLEFDGDFLARDDINSEVDVAYGDGT